MSAMHELARHGHFRGGALSLGAPLYTVRVDIGGAEIEAYVHDHGPSVVVPIAARLPTGGFVNAMIEVDRDTFADAIAIAEAHGLSAVRLADLVERAFGMRPLIGIETRPLLPR